MTKPINIRNIPDYEQLYDFIPRSQYTRNAVTQNRVISKLSSEQALVGNFQPNIEAVFRIPASTQALLNLAECYFSITGTFTMKSYTGSIAYPSLKCGPLWILKCLNKITLEIGGVAVHSITTPAHLAKLYESLAINYNDKEHGDLIDDQFLPGVDKCNYFGDYPVNIGASTWAQPVTNIVHSNVQAFPMAPKYDATNNNSLIQKPGLPKTSIVYLGVSDNERGTGVSQVAPTLGTSYFVYQFKINLKLKDVFPIETLRPIWAQSCCVKLNFESLGFSGILSSTGISPIIQNFEQFYLNVYQYNVNTEMAQKLNQVYSKPVVEIIDAIDKQVQTIPAISSNSDVQLFIPLATQFENSYISIFMPHNLSNNANAGLTMGSTTGGLMNKPLAKNFTQHTPMDYRFMNINRIQIIADGQVCYERTFNESSFKNTFAGDIFDSPLQPLITNVNDALTANSQSFSTTENHVALNDYSNLYELYKQCRCYWNVTEDSAMPFNEWLYSAFSITIPTSCFSRLTTGSQIVLSINFGQGMVNNPTITTASAMTNVGINERINFANGTNVTTEVLKQVVICQRYKKALVYNGFNNCSVKTITQSFEQDIEINEPMPENTNAN